MMKLNIKQAQNVLLATCLIFSAMIASANVIAAEKSIAPIPITLSGEAGSNKADFLGNYKKTGVLTKIIAGERSVIISGKKYIYGINTKVHTQQSSFSSIQSINRGATIGFNFFQHGESDRFLSEVWVIPKSSSLINNLDL